MMPRVGIVAIAFLALMSLRGAPADAYFVFPPCWYESSSHSNLIQWTHDGSQIVFENGMALYVVEANGSRLQRVADGAGGRSSSIIPPTLDGRLSVDVASDNSRIVFATCHYATTETRHRSFNDGTIYRTQYEIATSNIDGTEPQRLTRNTGFDHLPVWSPNGDRIAFITDRSSSVGPWGRYLHTMAADGSDVRNITPSLDLALYPPAWSPDGQRIAFVVDGRRPAIYTVRPDGSDLMRISEALSSPSWSPDGERIAFTKPHDDDGVGLYTIAADGSDARLVTVMQGNSGPWSPSWSPSGAEILVSCGTVCIINVEDGSLVGQSPISLHDGNVPTWSPDGSRIAVLMAQQFPFPNGSIVLYTMARDGTDLRVLVRGGRSLVAENSGWQDIDAGIASCSEGFVVSEPEKNPGLVKDCEILTGMRDTLAGESLWMPYDRHIDWRLPRRRDPGNVVLNWSPGTPIEQWTGVTIEDVCNPTSSLRMGICLPRVTGLDFKHQADIHYGLNYTFLTGTIPPDLGSLVHLRTLRLSGDPYWNHWSANGLLSGSIPTELGSLANLRVLDLSHNQLTGDIPAALGRLPNLQGLSLNGNELTGGIPPELGDLTELQKLRLENNRLTGSIPPELGDLTELQELRLENNQLTGKAPPELGSITSLERLELSGNPLECLAAELVYREDLEIDTRSLETCAADSYSFQVSELAGIGHLVGAVIVVDADTASYSIAAGNEDGAFAIEGDSGEITVVGPLDSEAVSSYSLTVEGRDGTEGTVTATVMITVLSRLEPCSKGIAVPDPGDNPDLVSDCAFLLAGRDTLDRYNLLNWRAGTPITSWKGVTVGGSPIRVQTLDLTRGGLDLPTDYVPTDIPPRISGSIPPALGGFDWAMGLGHQQQRHHGWHTGRVG